MNIVRTKNHGCFKRVDNKYWGSHYRPVADPEATLEKEELGFTLIPNFPKVPADYWAAIVDLYFHFAKSNLEVQVLFFRKENDITEWKVLVPQQQVTGASVNSKFDVMADIITGQLVSYDELEEGWVSSGSGHSHHKLTLNSFSGTDDENELGVPGQHILISNINLEKQTYVITASIVQSGVRHIVPYEQMIDLSPSSAKFHPSVLNLITLQSPRVQKGLVKSTSLKAKSTAATLFDYSGYSGSLADLEADCLNDWYGRIGAMSPNSTLDLPQIDRETKEYKEADSALYSLMMSPNGEEAVYELLEEYIHGMKDVY